MEAYPGPISRELPVVFDFDGVLAEGTWPRPDIGAPIEQGIAALAYYAGEGYEVIINTARPPSHRKRIWDFLKAQHVAHLVYDVVCGKPRGGLYIDDRAAKFPEAFERPERPKHERKDCPGYCYQHLSEEIFVR